MKEIPYRRIHMDFHTSPHIGGIGREFDPDHFARTLKNAGVQAVHLTAKCHHGMYYYPTRIGTVHPGLDFDLFGRQVEACRRHGILPVAYTPVVWNEDWADRHPEWLQVGMDGTLGIKKPFSAAYNSGGNCGWRYLCMNHPELVQYTKDELREIADAYHPGAFWVDIIWQRNCVCPACTGEMARLGLNPQEQADVSRHDRLVEIRFMRTIREFLAEAYPEIHLFFNSTSVDYDLCDDPDYSNQRKASYMTYLDIESLPTDVWSYSHFSVCVNYWNRKNIPLSMMNGRFHKAWGDFGSLRNPEALEYECFRALANGARVCVGDQLHPSGRIDNTVYAAIGSVFRRVEELEPWCKESTKISEIGVFTGSRVLDEGDHNEMGAVNEGVFRVLSEENRLFDFLDYQSALDGYHVVILPDQVSIPESLKPRLRAYLKQGGKLLLTGSSGLAEDGSGYALEECGAGYLGGAAYSPRYVRLRGDCFPGVPEMDYVVNERGVTIAAQEGSRVLARVVNPYFNRSWDKFCSHRQTPPCGEEGEPFALMNREGNIAVVASPLFRDYALNGNRVYRQVLSHMLFLLGGAPLIQAGLPVMGEVTLRQLPGGRRAVHLLYYAPQRKCRSMDIIEDRIPLYQVPVSLQADRPPRRVSLAPEGRELEFAFEDGAVRFTVPEINGYQMAVIEE